MSEALDVWFRFDDPQDEMATYEANTYRADRGYRVEWYHNDVGQVSSLWFPTRKAATAWLTAQGFEDFTA